MLNSLADAFAALQQGTPAERHNAAYYLGENPSPEAHTALLAALGDTDSHAHEAILLALLQQTAPDQIEQLVRVAQDPNPVRRNAALSALIELGVDRPELLCAGLQHSDPAVRWQVAQVLGDLHAPASAPALQACLHTPNETPEVRSAAATALGKLGDTDSVPALITAAEAGDFAVRHAAVTALGLIADARAVEPLLRLMSDAWLRPAIVQALGNLSQLEAVPALVGALDDEHEGVRSASLEALTKILIEPSGVSSPDTVKMQAIRRQISIAPLLRELQARAQPNSAYAAYLLGWLTPPEALPELINALGCEDETLRHAALEAVLRYGSAAVRPLAEAVNRRSEPLVCENAAELLGMLGDKTAVPVLLTHLKHPVLTVRQAVLRALGSLGGDAAYEGLLQALGQPATRDTALGVLGQLRTARTVEQLKHYLQQFLYEGQPDMRGAAALALSLFGDEMSVGILLNAMRQPDEHIRQAAAEALARVRGQRAVGPLIEALGDRDWLIRQKAVEALGQIPDGRAVAALLPLTRDPEWRVRRALVMALIHMGEGRGYESLRELARDADRWVRRLVMDLAAAYNDNRAVELLRLGLRDSDPHVCAAALISLGRRRDALAAEAVADFLYEGPLASRLAAVRAATLIPSPQNVRRLSQLADDADENIRMAVAEALGELADETGVEALENLLRDTAPAVQSRAAEALAHLKTPRAVEALAEALGHPEARPTAQAQLAQMGLTAIRALLNTARSSDAAVRAAAAGALGELRAHHAIPALQNLLTDPDSRVRRAAEAALKTIESPPRTEEKNRGS